MRRIGLRSIMIVREDSQVFATDALCRHMAWPLAYGGKVKDDCITCPLHQSKYDLKNGEVKEWSPFPLLPIYGRLLGSLRKPSPLVVHETRELDGWIEVRLFTA
jgi:nitrite reductase/ring-hydroxylating ferredoxin subunit